MLTKFAVTRLILIGRASAQVDPRIKQEARLKQNIPQFEEPVTNRPIVNQKHNNHAETCRNSARALRAQTPRH